MCKTSHHVPHIVVLMTGGCKDVDSYKTCDCPRPRRDLAGLGFVNFQEVAVLKISESCRNFEHQYEALPLLEVKPATWKKGYFLMNCFEFQIKKIKICTNHYTNYCCRQNRWMSRSPELRFNNMMIITKKQMQTGWASSRPWASSSIQVQIGTVSNLKAWPHVPGCLVTDWALQP